MSCSPVVLLPLGCNHALPVLLLLGGKLLPRRLGDKGRVLADSSRFPFIEAQNILAG